MATRMEKLLKTGGGVYTVQDLASIWQVADKQKVWNSVRYYLREGKLNRIHKGVYALGEYNEFELGQKLLVPSYVSFYSALAKWGLIYQYYGQVHLAALRSARLQAEGKEFVYHQIKPEVFYNQLGIEDEEGYRVVGPERAITDSLYWEPGLALDDMEGVEMDKLRKIAAIYGNKSLQERVEKIIEDHAG